MRNYTKMLENGIVVVSDDDYFFEKVTVTMETQGLYGATVKNVVLMFCIPWGIDEEFTDILDEVYRRYENTRCSVTEVKLECTFCDGEKFEKVFDWSTYLRIREVKNKN